ncbi:hypothetical protein EPUS_09413 [Endocarpon pusillum Z07020]|uniref:Amidoligase enzyme n=1 Tax=Endocarpon pusillum (strain Z07020 / HMAS-L-300199) TaxID=1263415 RepID=U1GLJ8_ENDPU|nr:uncharacterized protein EPUS_09413 [Endocarpon pusillum Z07020]ERF72766.1 hypothetical protein EPUS_09413 [Endocarpon pusillum Z07020]
MTSCTGARPKPTARSLGSQSTPYRDSTARTRKAERPSVGHATGSLTRLPLLGTNNTNQIGLTTSNASQPSAWDGRSSIPRRRLQQCSPSSSTVQANLSESGPACPWPRRSAAVQKIQPKNGQQHLSLEDETRKLLEWASTFPRESAMIEGSPEDLPDSRTGEYPVSLGNGEQQQRLAERFYWPSADRPLVMDEVVPWTRSEAPIIQIGMETEFKINIRDQNKFQPYIGDFAKDLAYKYNRRVPNKYPRMHPYIQPYLEQTKYDSWYLVEDSSILDSQVSPFGIELVSPMFSAFPGSTWREGVEAMWTYLHKYYLIHGNACCATHVHISLKPIYSLQEIKRIAQAAIHFEPAFEVLVPPERRWNWYARSNWIDNCGLALRDKSRPESIQLVEETSSMSGLMLLLHPFYERNYCWNFASLVTKGTIEFRKPPVSTSADEALCWAELVMSFIQTSIQCESMEKLQMVPPNVGGLRWFVSQFNVPGKNEPARLERLWQGKHPKAMLQPVPAGQIYPGVPLTPREKWHLARLARADRQRIERLAKNAREPYW